MAARPPEATEGPGWRALEVLEGQRDEARGAVARLDGQADRLSEWLAEGLAAAARVLASARWRLGDLLVHRLAKRLLRRPNRAVAWVPEELAGIETAFGHWRAARQQAPPSGTGPAETAAKAPERRRAAAVEEELEGLLVTLEERRSDLARLAGWIEKCLAAADELFASNRWRVGELLVGWGGGLAGGRVEAARLRLEATRRRFDEWQREAGRRFLDTDGAAARPRPLGPPGERPRIGEWRPRTVYESAGGPKGISIVVLNRNGSRHLHNLFASFLDTNTYSAVELVVVDHGSGDDSAAVVESFAAELPIRWLPQGKNHSFSFGNNRGAEAARGEYLFVLNNDVVFNRDVLAGLVERLEATGAGAVGAGLRYPEYYEVSPGGVQHAGIGFRPDADFFFFRPFNLTRLAAARSTSESPAVTGAALFCRREVFLEAGGFDEGYVYGYEDVDLCLRLRARSGLASLVAHDLELIHDESSTQRTQSSDELRRRRRGNIARLARRFGYAVKRGYWSDKIAGRRFWTDRPLRIGFAVEEAGPDARAGDYFTASELARACERELGWVARFLARRDLAADWYDAAGLDVLVVMLDGYDLDRLRRLEPGLLKVAWMRNWFDRWAGRAWFDGFDVYLCSSQRAADHLRSEHGKPAEVLRIATDPERFAPGPVDPELESDYCFTGSYWNAARELEGLKPGRIGADFALFGNGWQDHGRFRRHRRGFVPYGQIHRVYQSTRLVVDDANHATKPWGSVNSRVFDALAAGALVVTNGRRGSDEAFDGALPSYDSVEELTRMVRRYLADDTARREKLEELRRIVLERHTYPRRAHELAAILGRFVRDRFRIAIKVPCPRAEERHQWGDYHMAVALGRRFERAGHKVRIDLLPDWDRPEGIGDDVVFVFRGLSRYDPKPAHINLLWNITHPERVPDEELELYDHVFVASVSHARVVGERLRVEVSELLQCADPEVFRPESGVETAREMLFVGNSRQQPRPIVRHAIAAGLPLTVFGAMWEGLIPPRYVEGEHIPNDELHRFYSDAGVLLNDHWPSMSRHGFLSNRLFDAGACGACVVSDEAVGLGELFGDAVATYDGTPEGLRTVVESLLGDPDRRRDMGRRLRDVVLGGHTFDHRAGRILEVCERLHRDRMAGLWPPEPTPPEMRAAGGPPAEAPASPAGAGS